MSKVVSAAEYDFAQKILFIVRTLGTRDDMRRSYKDDKLEIYYFEGECFPNGDYHNGSLVVLLHLPSGGKWVYKYETYTQRLIRKRNGFWQMYLEDLYEKTEACFKNPEGSDHFEPIDDKELFPQQYAEYNA